MWIGPGVGPAKRGIRRWRSMVLLRLGLVTSRSSYTGSVFKVVSGRIRIESVVQVIFDV